MGVKINERWRFDPQGHPRFPSRDQKPISAVRGWVGTISGHTFTSPSVSHWVEVSEISASFFPLAPEATDIIFAHDHKTSGGC